MNPIFLSLTEVIIIHKDQINRYGGDTGIRDLELLKSAIAMPQSGVEGEYFHKSIYDMAAAYMFHILQNHPFIDGNKRTGVVTALVFLALNGVENDADENEMEQLVWDVAQGRADKARISRFLQCSSVLEL